ncbi:MAG: serine protease, partial [Thermoleophilia bacterium]|nr:serine protease [Thermoleophilia bacterium]
MSPASTPVYRASRLVFIAFLAVVAACVTAAGLSQSAAAAPLHGRIVNGTQVSTPTFNAKWSFIVGLIDPAASNSRSGQFCAGSLISPTRVVTAAHCVLDPYSDGGATKPANIKVLVGRRTLSDNASGQLLAVSNIIVNPDYDPFTNASDIAVLRLATPATLGTPIAPVHVGENTLWGGGLGKGFTAPDGPYIGGWGALGETAALPDTLREAGVPLISDSACSDGGGANGIGYGTIFDAATMQCGGILDTSVPSAGVSNGSDSCYGDSGGPLIVGDGLGTFHLAGIVSFGFQCADRSSYGIYTRVGAFSAWLDSDPPTLPVSTARPLVTGKAAVGSTLSCGTGTWTSESQPLTYTFAWGYGDVLDGVDGPAFGVQRIPNATSATYKPTNADSFNRLVCIVTAKSAAGSTARASIPGSPVIGATPEFVNAVPFSTNITSTVCTAKVCAVNVTLKNLFGTRVVALDAVVTVRRQIHHYNGVQTGATTWTVGVPRATRKQSVRITATDRLGVASTSQTTSVRARTRSKVTHKRHHVKRYVAGSAVDQRHVANRGFITAR